MFEKVSGTLDYSFYGRIFVNLYQSKPANLVEAIKRGKQLDSQKQHYFGGALTSPGVNITALMEREYFSANTDIRTLLFNIAKNHLEIGYIFAL